MLYSFNGAYPRPLPNKIVLSNGRIRTDRSSFTPEEIADAGYVEAPEQPSFDALSEQLGWDGKAWTVSPAPRPTGDQVNDERDRRIVEGSQFTVTGYGQTIHLTGRIQDQVVLQGRLLEAQMMLSQGDTTTTLVIRDGGNVNRHLTPSQMIELVSKGVQWVEDTMKVSWAMKDGTGAFQDGIPYDFRDDKYWPD